MQNEFQWNDENLKGELPPEIGLLTEMSLLDLGNNDISRYLPSFAPLTKLVVLSLTNNDLEGPISKSLEELISLQTLDLSNNELSGNVLNVANLTSLQTVRLDGNKLNGEVHTSFGDLPLLGEFMRYLIAFLLSYHTDHASHFCAIGLGQRH